MKSILNAFTAAAPREKLAIVADVLSVVGISLLAVISPLAAGISRKTLWAYISAGVLALLVLAGLAVLLAFASGLSGYCRRRYKAPVASGSITFAIWCAYLVLVLCGAYIVITRAWDYFASVT